MNHTTQYQCNGQEGGILDLKQSLSQLFDQNDTLAVDYYDFFIEKFVSAANQLLKDGNGQQIFLIWQLLLYYRAFAEETTFKSLYSTIGKENMKKLA